MLRILNSYYSILNMSSDLEKEFEEYWTDRIPGLLEYSRIILNSNTDLSFILNIFLKDKGQCKIIDMGTGVGTLAIELALMGHEVHAMDNNPKMIDAARELANEFGVEVRFIEGDILDPDIPEQKYDVVVARNCLWNLTEPSKAYTSWKKLLKPGG